MAKDESDYCLPKLKYIIKEFDRECLRCENIFTARGRFMRFCVYCKRLSEWEDDVRLPLKNIKSERHDTPDFIDIVD